MRSKLLPSICLGGLAMLSSLNVFGQVTTVTENFDNNLVPSAFSANQGYSLSASNGTLKVRAGKTFFEEFGYNLPMNLTARPIVSFKVRSVEFVELVVAFTDSDGKSNRFPASAIVYPSSEFIDVSFDMTGLLKEVSPAKINSVRFAIQPANRKSGVVEFDDFKVGGAAQSFPRMIAPVPMVQNVGVSASQQTVLLRGMQAGATTVAVSSNPALIPNPTVSGVNASGISELKYTPVAGQSGTAKITLTVSQAGKSNLVLPFNIIVSANKAPTIADVSAVTMGGSQTFTVDLSDITDGNIEKEQKITFSATSSDQAVLKNANIKFDYSDPLTRGKMTLTTEALASGSKDVNITLTLKDDGGTSFGGVDTKTIVVPLKVFAVYYKMPTMAALSNNNFAYVGTEYTEVLTNISDGNGGNKVSGIVATSSNTVAADNPIVSYTPGATTATLKYKLKNKQTTTFNIVISNTGAPANSNGNSSNTYSFVAKGTDPPYTGYIEDFSTYGVDGKPVTKNVLGDDYYSSGTGGNNRVAWMTNLEGSDNKWFIEGQGVEQTFTLDPANKKATVKFNKPADFPNTFAGIWYTPRRLFNLSGSKNLSLRVSCNPGSTVTFDLFDVNNNRYGNLEVNQKRVNATGAVYTFSFQGKPDDKGFDFSKVACVLINVSNMIAYNGEVSISELRIGSDAVGAPAPLPAGINILPIPDRTIFAGSKGIDIILHDVAVLKDQIDQNANITITATSSNASLIPNPIVGSVVKNMAAVKIRPNAGTGSAIITLKASSPGVADKTFTFNVNVIDKNSGSAGNVAINTSQTFQTIQGIGCIGTFPVFTVDPDETVGDLGASMLRIDISADYSGLSETDENDNSDPFVLDITKFKYQDNFEVFKKTKELGCDRVIGCVWTPPIWMKGMLAYNPLFDSQETPNKLLPEFYDEFAEFILGACLGFKNQFGYEMYSVCLQNEAEFASASNATATCGYTREQAAEVVRRVYPRLRAAGLSTRIHGFDQLPVQGNVLNWFQYFNSPAAGTQTMFDAFSIHAYGANAIDPAQLNNQQLQDYYAECQKGANKKELWMTETSGGPLGEAGGVDEMSSEFSAYANNMSAWVPLGIEKKFGMRFYVMKNFAKFVRPGAVRVGTVSSGGAAGIAFKHDANKTYSVVLVNTSGNPQQVKLSGAGLPSKMYAYLTAFNINCQLVDSVTTADNYMVNLPARSIMTLYSKYEDLLSSEDMDIANMEMIVYPNPSKGEVNIMLPSSNFKEVSVLDITGRVVLTQAVKANGTGTERLDLSGLQKGMYIISAKGSATLRKKVIVE
ncbi:MAG: T9SS C-terminal target domain-containing protein [Cytophagales bacterium]|nr:MAG: T9SS C-terminal target domain-containing protein [Cytophagales bacterium]